MAGDGGAPDSGIPDPFYEESHKLENHTIYTFKGVTGQGTLFDGSRTNNLTSTITIRQIGDAPSPPGGDYHEIASSVDYSGHFTVYEKTWLRVFEGAIGSVTEERGEATITTEIIVAKTGSGSPGSSITDPFYVGSEQKEHYTIWTYKGVTGSGTIEVKTDTLFNGAVTVNSVKAIGSAPSVSGTVITDRWFYEGNLKIYHKVGVTGGGKVRSSTQYKGNVTITSESHVVGDGGSNPTPSNVFEVSEEAKDGYTIYSWKEVSGSGSFTLRPKNFMTAR